MSCTSDTGITTLDKFCQLDHHVHRHNSNFTNITPDNQASSGHPSHPFFSISSSLTPVLKASIKSTVWWLHWADAEVGRWVTATNWTSLTPSDTSHGTPAPVSPLLVEPMDCFSARSPVRDVVLMFPVQLGKTEVAKQLANTLGVELLRFDMSEYMEKHAVSRLIGAPPGLAASFARDFIFFITTGQTVSDW